MKIFKCLLALVAAAAVFGVGVGSAYFTDVNGYDANYDAIMYVQEHDIVGGYADGSFDPYGLINRAELLKILVLAREGVEISGEQADNCFKDVSASAWYAKYVCYAKSQGYVDGYPDGSFKPGDYISFVEAAKMAIVTLGYLAYPDSEVWYRPYVYALEERSAIPATVNTFDIEMMRGEIAEIIYRLDAQITTKETMTYDCLKWGTSCPGGGSSDGWSGDGGGGWSAGSTFSYYDVQIGDVIAGWTLTDMGMFSDMIEPGPGNSIFHFEGTATLTGTYEYVGDDAYAMMSDYIYFHDLDSDSLYYLPWMMESDGEPEWTWFSFSNQEEVKARFGVVDGVSKSGQATILIEDFVLVHYPSEVSSMATLVDVLVPQ